MSLVSLFWRTFAQLATGVLVAALGYDFVSDSRASVSLLGLGLLAALVGAVVAVIHAYAAEPATSALQKALRSGAQAIAGTLVGLAFNAVSDLTADVHVIVGGIAAVVLSFGITFLQNQGAPPAPAG